MKKYTKVLTIVWLITAQSSVSAQFWSTQATFSPSSATLLSDASRFRYHYNNHSTYYMRYADSSYLCNTVYYTVAYSPISTKIQLPQDFVITQFKPFILQQGFIGSFQGVGMYGIAYSTFSPFSNSLQIFKLPAIRELYRIATVESSNQNIGYQLKAYAIGEKAYSKAPPESCILEFYAQGNGVFTQYRYAPLGYDHYSGNNEVAEDVITLKSHVVFATRDSRANHTPVNLRISDTSDALSGTDIDYQWQFSLPAKRRVIGGLRLIPLLSDDFVLSYTIYDSVSSGYRLCIHRLVLSDLLAGTNSHVYYEIGIDKSCTSLVDMVYEPDVKILVLLLNGHGQSRIYHTDPYSSVSTTATRLDYPDGELTSIDTIGDYLPYNADMYVALGGDRFFSQNISTAIDSSCLAIAHDKMLLLDAPHIKKTEDPIDCLSGNKNFIPQDYPSDAFYGSRDCGIIHFNTKRE